MHTRTVCAPLVPAKTEFGGCMLAKVENPQFTFEPFFHSWRAPLGSSKVAAFDGRAAHLFTPGRQ